MKNEYTPRRANLTRWLKDAPDYILDCFDSPEFNDRYTVILGKSQATRTGQYHETYLSYIGSDSSGGTYYGEFSAYDAVRFRYANGKKRIAWLDLPERVRQSIIARVEDDIC